MRRRILDHPRAGLNVPDRCFGGAVMFEHIGIFAQDGRDIGVLRSELAFVQPDRFAVKRFGIVPCALLRSQHGETADSISKSPSVLQETAFRLDRRRKYSLRFGGFMFVQVESSQIHLCKNDLDAAGRNLTVQDGQSFFGAIFGNPKFAECRFNRSEFGEHVDEYHAIRAQTRFDDKARAA